MFKNKLFDENVIYFDNSSFALFWEHWQDSPDQLKAIYKKMAVESVIVNYLSDDNKRRFKMIEQFYINDPLIEYLSRELDKISDVKIGEKEPHEIKNLLSVKEYYTFLINKTKTDSLHGMLELVVDAILTDSYATVERNLASKLYKKMALKDFFDSETRSKIVDRFKYFGFEYSDE